MAMLMRGHIGVSRHWVRLGNVWLPSQRQRKICGRHGAEQQRHIRLGAPGMLPQLRQGVLGLVCLEGRHQSAEARLSFGDKLEVTQVQLGEPHKLGVHPCRLVKGGNLLVKLRRLARQSRPFDAQ